MEVEVGDTGCGIPEKQIKKIFDPLFTTKPRGTWIGLAVCHGIIQKHNGVIDVKSQEESEQQCSSSCHQIAMIPDQSNKVQIHKK